MKPVSPPARRRRRGRNRRGAPDVVIASRIYLPEPAAASFRLAALAKALSDSGASVRVLTTRTPGDEREPHVPGVDVRRVPVLRDPQGYVRGYLHYLSFDLPLVGRLLLARRPDVVVSEPPPTTGAIVRAVCMVRRIPYVHYAADIWSDASESTTAPKAVVRAVRAVERSVVTHANAVLSVSDGVSERLRALGASTNIVTVGNGIDTAVFTPGGETQVLAGPFFVYAGTASEIQGATVFIDAFEQVLGRHPEARLVFIGLGVDLPAMEAAAARLPAGTVTFLGRLPGDQTAQWLRGAHASLASVRPGLGYDFMIPTKIYASVACGTPVIYAGPGPSRALVADNDLGSAVDYDAAQVAEAMLAAVRTEFTPHERQRLAAWAVSAVSLATVGSRAADVVLGAAQARTRRSA